MAVNTTESQKSFDGNGVSTSFSFGFPFFSKDDIVVVLYDSDGNGAVQTIGIDYTIPGAIWITGGQVDMITPPATGETLIVSRIVDFLQEFGFRNLGSFRAEVHENAFDKIVMMLQQLNTVQGRTVKFKQFVTNRPEVDELTDSEFLIKLGDSIVSSGLSTSDLIDVIDSIPSFIVRTGDSMTGTLSGPPATDPNNYMPQFQLVEVVDDRIESIPGFDPQQFLDYGLITSAVTDVYDYGSVV